MLRYNAVESLFVVWVLFWFLLHVINLEQFLALPLPLCINFSLKNIKKSFSFHFLLLSQLPLQTLIFSRLFMYFPSSLPRSPHRCMHVWHLFDAGSFSENKVCVVLVRRRKKQKKIANMYVERKWEIFTYYSIWTFVFIFISPFYLSRYIFFGRLLLFCCCSTWNSSRILLPLLLRSSVSLLSESVNIFLSTGWRGMTHPTWASENVKELFTRKKVKEQRMENLIFPLHHRSLVVFLFCFFRSLHILFRFLFVFLFTTKAERRNRGSTARLGRAVWESIDQPVPASSSYVLVRICEGNSSFSTIINIEEHRCLERDSHDDSGNSYQVHNRLIEHRRFTRIVHTRELSDGWLKSENGANNWINIGDDDVQEGFWARRRFSCSVWLTAHVLLLLLLLRHGEARRRRSAGEKKWSLWSAGTCYHNKNTPYQQAQTTPSIST